MNDAAKDFFSADGAVKPADAPARGIAEVAAEHRATVLELLPLAARTETAAERAAADGDGDGAPLPRVRNFLGGAFVEPASGAWIVDTNPATGAPLARVGASNAADVAAAVDAASAAMAGEWGRTTVAQRCDLLERIADAMRARAEQLATLEVTARNTSPLRSGTALASPRRGTDHVSARPSAREVTATPSV